MPIEHDGHEHPDPTEEQLRVAKLPHGFPLHSGVIKVHLGANKIVGVTTETMVLEGTSVEEVGTALMYALMYALTKAAMLIKASRGREIMHVEGQRVTDLAEALRGIGPEQVEKVLNEVMDETREEMKRLLGIESTTDTDNPTDRAPATTPVPDVFRAAFGQEGEGQSNGG